MIIRKGTHVILATHVGEAAGLDHWRALHAYRDLHAGTLAEDFRYGRGEIVVIGGPMGGTFPTREVELTPVLSDGRAVGVKWFLPFAGGGRIRHLMMVEPFDPAPIDPHIAWPAHLHVAREKIELLSIAYEDREVQALFKQLG